MIQGMNSFSWGQSTIQALTWQNIFESTFMPTPFGQMKVRMAAEYNPVSRRSSHLLTLKLISSASPECRPYYQVLPILSAMFAPLLVEGACIGVFSIARHNPNQPSYTREDLIFFMHAAGLCAIAIWQARTMDMLRQELRELEGWAKALELRELKPPTTVTGSLS
jgi:GAF domain-containing protein